VKELSDQAVAAPPRLNLAEWRAGFEELFARIAGRFAQACSRKRARAYLLGLLSRTERKNGRTIAELAGDATPDGMQRLLNFTPGQRTRSAMTCVRTWPRPSATSAGC
jgi:hypothetical protein